MRGAIGPAPASGLSMSSQPDQTSPPAQTGHKVHSPQSVTRVIRILEALCASADPVSLADISRQLDAPKSSVVSLLRGLEEAGFVQASDNGWRLGPGAFGLGSALVAARGQVQSSELIHKGMADLARASSETVIFAVLNEDGASITYVDVIESRETVRFTVAVGNRRDLYCTAGGRVLLAGMEDEAVDAYLAALTPQAHTGATVTDIVAIRAAIAGARKTGVAQTMDQAANGATGTAAAIRNAGGHVLGALVLAAPTARAQDRLALLRDQVATAASAISRSLGYRG